MTTPVSTEAAAMPDARGDPVAFELVKNALFFLVNEMALTLVRASYSGILRENMDFSTGIADPDGEMVTQGLSLPLQFGPMPDAVEAVRRAWDGRMEPGDVFVLNDPFEGGTHLPDFFFIKPVFHDGAVFCYACVAGHQIDVGGRVAGSNACDSTEVYAEGLRVPPLKLYERGVPNETLFGIIERNVRVPVKLLGDFRAQVASLDTGERGIADLIARYGAAGMKRYFAALLDYGERQTRAAIARLPAGEYHFTDYLDSDGIERRPVPIVLKLTIAADRIVADFTGSSPQVQGAINSTISMAKSSTYAAIRSVLRDDIPSNGGFFRAIEVIAEEGSILNCVLPAASGGRGVTLFRIMDCVWGALAQAVPELVFASTEGGTTIYSFGGYDEARNPFVFVEVFGGSWGGRPDRDGIDGISHPALNQRNIPAEHIEMEHPVELLRYGFVPDTGGAGKFRGGLSLVRDIRYLGKVPAQLQVRSDRCDHMPWGLAGGRDGTPSYNILNPGTEAERRLQAMDTTTIRPGEIARFVCSSAGGWGDPLERDPSAVAADIRKGRLSAAYAREHYALAFSEKGELDEAETGRLRGRPVTRGSTA